MTQNDLRLDTSLIQANPLTLYRLTRASFATLGGFGSAAFPGRWNRRGQRALYTSTEQGTCILERSAHQPNKSFIPTNLVMMKLRVSGNWFEDPGGHLQDRETGALVLRYPSLWTAHALLESVGAPDLLAISVPSVLAPVWNVVLYPECEWFTRHVSLDDVRSFQFDPRLFTEDASYEASS